MTLLTRNSSSGSSPGSSRLDVRTGGGFTLIELLVVLVIISIVLVSVVPEFRGSGREARLRADTSRLASMLRLARSHAVSTGRAVRFTLDPVEHEARLEVRDETGGFRAPRGIERPVRELEEELRIGLRPVENRNYRHRRSREFLRDRGEPGGIFFQPDGSCDPAEIFLVADDGPGLKIVLDSLTSRVRILPGDALVEDDGPPGDRVTSRRGRRSR